MKALLFLLLGVGLLACAGCEAAPPANNLKPTILNDQVSEIGITSVDPNWSNFGAYLFRLTTSIRTEWDRELGTGKFIPTAGGKVSVVFVMNSKGEIARVVRHDDLGTHASQETVQSCILAVTKPSPYPTWTDDMIADLGTEQKMTFTFFVP
jgi:hypothetical protein